MSPPEIVTLDVTEPLEKIYDVIARDGGVIIRNFLTPELLRDFVQKIKPHFLNRKHNMADGVKNEMGAEFFPTGTQRVYSLLGKLPNEVCQVITNPVWQGIMEHFLADEYSTYTGDKFVAQKSGWMLSTSAGLQLSPGTQAQPLQRDQLAYLIKEDPSNPLFTPMVGCLIAGNRCTEKNGATKVIPGSHLWPHSRAPTVEEAVSAVMEPGSALFTLGSTYHGGGENKCDSTDADAYRTMFAIFGQRDYFRQDQEEILSTPIEVARSFSPEILKIAGYHRSLGGVGYVEEHQSAADFLHLSTGLGAFGASRAAKIAL